MKILYIFFVAGLLIFSLPLQITIAILIFLTSGRPVFYKQKRVGQNNIPFVLYKFRTMVRNADQMKKTLTKQNEAYGPVFKIRSDPRFTPIGSFLSHTGLDELPQILNILKGNMAIIGPRPLPIEEVKKLKSWQKDRHAVKPGIISQWIVNGYHTQSFDDWMKSDVEYAKTKNVRADLLLFLKAGAFFVSLIYKEMASFLF